jgi:hypothetical protein
MRPRWVAPLTIVLAACSKDGGSTARVAPLAGSARATPTGAEPGAGRVAPCVQYPETGVGQPLTDEYLRQHGAAQAAGLAGARIEIVRAYRYPPAEVLDGRRLPQVAVDVDLAIPCSSFDPDDLELVDAATGRSLGDTLASFRMTERGEFADWRDPHFTDPHRLRALFVYPVERVPSVVKLRYWDQDLPVRATVERDGPVAPEERQSVLGWVALPSPSGHRTMHIVHVLATDWPRTRTPLAWLGYRIREGDEQRIIVNRWIEVDESQAPLQIDLEERPFHVARRRFLMQFITPEGARPTAIDGFGRLASPPSLRLPPATQAALLAAKKDCESCEE